MDKMRKGKVGWRAKVRRKRHARRKEGAWAFCRRRKTPSAGEGKSDRDRCEFSWAGNMERAGGPTVAQLALASSRTRPLWSHAPSTLACTLPSPSQVLCGSSVVPCTLQQLAPAAPLHPLDPPNIPPCPPYSRRYPVSAHSCYSVVSYPAATWAIACVSPPPRASPSALPRIWRMHVARGLRLRN